MNVAVLLYCHLLQRFVLAFQSRKFNGLWPIAFNKPLFYNSNGDRPENNNANPDSYCID